MFLHVDGHKIPVLTQDDLKDDDAHAAFGTPTHATSDASGHMEALLPGSSEKATMYDVSTTDPRVKIDYTMVRPPGRGTPMNMASLRPMRAEGREDGPSDTLHQIRLFHAVGSVAVASGHVEMAMRKVLVSLKGGQNADLADRDIPADWNQLHTKLKALCRTGQTELQRSVELLLDEAERSKIRDSRNHVIHGYWWLVAMGDDFVAGRYFHPAAKLPPAILHGSASQMQELAGKLFAFAARLEALVTPDWPIAIVPALGDYRGPSGSDIALRERLDDATTKSDELRVVAKSTKPKPGQKPVRSRKGTRKRR